MVKKAHFLSSIRLFKKHIARFLTIAAVALVAISFTSGLSETEEQVKSAATNEYRDKNVSDLYIKSKNDLGFSEAEKAYFIERFGEENLRFSFCYEFKEKGDIYRLYAQELDRNDVDEIVLMRGTMPDDADEILVERGTYDLKTLPVGGSVTLSILTFQKTLTVTGATLHPLFLYERDNVSYRYDGEIVDYVLYVDYGSMSQLAGFDFSLVNDVYIKLSDAERNTFNAFSSKYGKIIDGYKASVTADLGEENVKVLSLYENAGFYSMVVYAEKVGLISIVFIVFFLAVTLLVVYSTMSRLFTEERAEIACQKTLGYSDFSILAKYLFFDLVATSVGGGIAYGVGLILTKLIYNGFGLQYTMPPYPAQGGALLYLLCLSVIVLGTFLLTLLTGLRVVGQKPVALLSAKAPKAGRKVVVEKIPFIWNRLSFKHKSTVRNVLLFRSRFYMTVVSVVGSAVLVFSGFSLMDNSSAIPNGQTLVGISILLVVFSALLCALVIYNLTNINVSERCREIATLMVLGYSDEEVVGYVYREIYLMCAVGALLGVPFGVLFVHFVFLYIGIGDISAVNWWTYLVTPALTMLFCFLSTRLLKRKITKTDMNASLKMLE